MTTACSTFLNILVLDLKLINDTNSNSDINLLSFKNIIQT